MRVFRSIGSFVFVLLMSLVISSATIFAQAQVFGFEVLNKCLQPDGQVAWRVTNHGEFDLPIRWEMGLHWGEFSVPGWDITGDGTYDYGESGFIAPASSTEEMKISSETELWTGSADNAQPCEYHVNGMLTSSSVIAPETLLRVVFTSSLDRVVFDCTPAECTTVENAYEDPRTLEVPFGEPYTVDATFFGSVSYPIISGLGTFLYEARQVPYDKTPLHYIELGSEFAGVAPTPVAQCPDIVLATAANAADGLKRVITVKDTVNGQGNVFLHFGEQPSMHSSGLWYAGISNGDLYIASTKMASKQTFLTLDGETIVDSDPSVSPSVDTTLIAFKRNDMFGTNHLFMIQGGKVVQYMDNTGMVIDLGHANMAWSPDGKYLAFGNIIGSLYILEVATGELRFIETPLVSELDWGPQFLALTSSETKSGRSQIFLIDPAAADPASTIRAINETGHQINPAFNELGLLAYSSEELPSGNLSVWVYDPATDRSELVKTGQLTVATQPTWWCVSTLVYQADRDVKAPGGYDMEIFSVPFPGTAEPIFESEATYVNTQVQYGSVGAANQNNPSESFWATWFDFTRFAPKEE